MTIEGAIKHCEEVAEENEKFCFKKNGKGGYFNEDTDWDNKKCAEEHRQLAEWLKDYQRLQKAIEDIRTEISSERYAHLQKESAYYDVNFEDHSAEEIAEAFDIAFKALETLDSIYSIIEAYNIDYHTDCDILSDMEMEILETLGLSER